MENKVGRPTKWEGELKETAIGIILDRIISGESVRQILDNADRNILPSYRVWIEWLANNEELCKQYVYACEGRAELLFDQVLDIADDSSKDIEEVEVSEGVFVDKVNHEHIQRSRLRFDARRWYLSKLSPKRFGDKIQTDTNLTGEVAIVWKEEKTYDSEAK